MRREAIERQPLNLLSAAQRAFYFAHGYVVLERFLDAARLEALRGAMADLQARAEDPASCPPDFEFEPTGDGRRLRQVLCAADHHPAVWDYASASPLVEAVADLVGPDVKFRESNVAFKAPGGRGFAWHQDIVFFPASNGAMLMTLTFLDEVTTELGPTRIIPGSHRGRIFDHYGPDGAWKGVIGDQEKHLIPEAEAIEVTAPAGSVLITDCALVHCAAPNRGSRSRPVVIAGYQAADAVCHVDIPYRSRHKWQIVRGRPSPHVHTEEGTWKLPPDWNAHAGIRIDNLYQQKV